MFPFVQPTRTEHKVVEEEKPATSPDGTNNKWQQPMTRKRAVAGTRNMLGARIALTELDTPPRPVNPAKKETPIGSSTWIYWWHLKGETSPLRSPLLRTLSESGSIACLWCNHSFVWCSDSDNQQWKWKHAHNGAGAGKCFVCCTRSKISYSTTHFYWWYWWYRWLIHKLQFHFVALCFDT